MEAIDKRKLPMKFILGIAYTTENTNTWELVLYDLLNDDSVFEGKKITIDYVAHTLMFHLDRKPLRACMDELISFGYVVNAGDGRSPLYQVINHSWHE